MQNSGFRSCRLMPPVRFLVSTSDLSLQQAELVRAMWVNELNCEESQIQLDQVQFGALLANTRPDAGAARPDVWELGWSSYYPDAHNWLYELLHCAESENRTNRPCGQADTLLVRADSSAAWDERVGLYREAENLFFGSDGETPLAPLYVRGDYVLVQTWLTDYALPRFGGPNFDTFVLNADLKRLERSRTQ
jgi:ABC-type oligopeptide transport system substrate-binding subunit